MKSGISQKLLYGCETLIADNKNDVIWKTKAFIILKFISEYWSDKI
jgi:hypothetical protein